MKIKHFSGYGSVNATKIKNNNYDLVVKVVGNHEWGVYRDDIYDLFNWLVKRFDKNIGSFNEFRYKNPTVKIEEDYKNNEEICTYYFKYKGE